MSRFSTLFQNMSIWRQCIMLCCLVTISCCLFSDCFLCKVWPIKMQMREGFDSSMMKATTAPLLTLYYTSWCPMSVAMMKEWDKVTQIYLGTGMKTSAVDCDAEPEKMRAANVVGFPTIVLTRDGVSTEYTGIRQAPAIARFVELS